MTASVGARGPERNAPEASAGLALGLEDQSLFPPERAGRIVPAPSTEKSAPHDSKRSGLAPEPWDRLALEKFLFSKALKFYKFLMGLKLQVRSASSFFGFFSPSNL